MSHVSEQFFKRISFSGQLEDIAVELCSVYRLGEFQSCRLIEVGYEDFNFSLRSSQGSYFVKVFSDFRTLEDCRRYVEIMKAVGEAGISTPALITSDGESLCLIDVRDVPLRLSVMQHVDGDNLLSLSTSLNQEEIKFLAHQASLIAQIDLHPAPVYDSWAIPNFMKEFSEKGEYLSKEDRQVLRPLLDAYNRLHIEELPHCFVHGDIIASNVMKDSIGKLWIVDFSVSNYYPRIQELAVLACNLLLSPQGVEKSRQNLKIALQEYERYTPLSQKEKDALWDYIVLAHAMHVLCANYEEGVNCNQTEENRYWLEQGRLGLRQLGFYS